MQKPNPLVPFQTLTLRYHRTDPEPKNCVFLHCIGTDPVVLIDGKEFRTTWSLLEEREETIFDCHAYMKHARRKETEAFNALVTTRLAYLEEFDEPRSAKDFDFKQKQYDDAIDHYDGMVKLRRLTEKLFFEYKRTHNVSQDATS